MFTRYPRRTILGFSLFIGQAFLYNAITFGYAQILTTRALAIAFFCAIGTAAGGISGPLLFSALVSTGKVSDTVIAFSIGATLMVLAGLVELFLWGQGRAAEPGRHRPAADRGRRRPNRSQSRLGSLKADVST
jgi:hypothetical protein